MLIDFSQFLYDSVEKVLFKAFFFLHDRNAKANTSTQSVYTVYIICSHIYCHSAMHNNLNILEMKRVLELQPFFPNANMTGSNVVNVLKGARSCAPKELNLFC